MENFYNILEINENATQDEIKKSYRKLSLKHHPDRNGNSPECVEKIQKINEAYETLGDEKKRKSYDYDLKHPGMQGLQGMHGMPGMHGMHGMSFGMDNIFEHLFFGMEESPNIRIFHNGMRIDKPTPIIKTIEIEIEQVLTGGNIPIEIERWFVDNGLKIFETETIYVDIPKGVDDNEIIILRERGNVSREKISGDIKIFIKIINKTQFQRNGLDLIYDKTISLKDSLCGFSFDLKYINGKKYTINNQIGNIISPGYKKVIPKMGLEREGHHGNLIIVFHIQFPESLPMDKILQIKECL